ncbi:MAG: KTSC domain-containing protein [candidate division Zixibacteria bacterium]|nr:KTSC domain-containing protein [candidate division Zixibacteria bacterium]
MERVCIMSSSLASVGYNSIKQTLEIEFNWGGVYQYHDVPEEVYIKLLASDSPGQYFKRYINKAGFEFEKVG